MAMSSGKHGESQCDCDKLTPSYRTQCSGPTGCLVNPLEHDFTRWKSLDVLSILRRLEGIAELSAPSFSIATAYSHISVAGKLLPYPIRLFIFN